MNRIEDKIARLKAIMWTGLLDAPTQDQALELQNEVETICGDLYETQDDWLMNQDGSTPQVGIGYFDNKLFGMKSAVLAALGIARDDASDETISSNFEHFSYIVETELRH